ncbi:MAG TPA: filamentous hemagglutinin N-terminal domain-containing protein [Waterburya sp.]
MVTEYWLGWCKRLSLMSWVGVIEAIALGGGMASAQITPDTTLGAEGSVVTPGVVIRGRVSDRIDGGAQRGGNLFHSFSQFNVGDGQRVYFASPTDVQNILTRVTGGTVSNIQGVLGVDGSANLFLLNPNGIIFGLNARTDLSGAFVGTTANGIQFGNQGVFSATKPDAPPLLTINPSALLFNQLNPGAIINRARPTTTDASFSPQQGSRFLVGGDITFDGGFLFAVSNRLELGGLVGVGAVELIGSGNELRLNFPAGVPRADIVLQNKAAALTTGGGAITVYARNLTLSSTSQITTALQAGAGAAGSRSGNVTINATGTVALDGRSFIANLGIDNSLGDTGNVEIDAQSIRLTNTSQISTDGERNRGSIRLNATEDVTLDSNSLIATFGNRTSIGESGDISITARTINLSNRAAINSGNIGQGRGGRTILQAQDTISLSSRSSISSSSAASVFGGVNREPSGDIEIRARSLSLDGQYTSISSRNFDEGRSGNIQITTDDSVSLNGYSYISSSTGGQGDGGDIQIQTRQLSLFNGAFIDTLTSGQGNSGNLLVNASDAVSLSGSTVITSRTGEQIVSNSSLSTSTFSSGNAGRITINTGRLSLQGGGAINANTGIDNTGQGGDIAIRATDAIEVVGEQTDGRFGSNISTATLGSGNAGNLTLETRFLSIRDGALVTAGASTNSSGQGGNLLVNASEAVEVVGISRNNSNFSALVAGTLGSGDAGSLTINTRRLSIRDGAGVGTGTRAGSSGRGGDLTVNASDLVEVVGTTPDGQGSSTLSASTAGSGDAGNLTINTRHLSVRGLGVVATSADSGSTGQGGTLTVNASDSVEVVGQSPDGNRGSVISTSTFSSGNAGRMNISTQRLSLREGGFITTEARLGSTGQGGDLTVNASDLVEVVGNAPKSESFSLLTTSTSGSGNAGRLSITTRRLSVRNGGYISTQANSGSTGKGGDLAINASDWVEVVSSSPDDIFGSGLSTFTGGTGNAGRLSIDTRRLSVGNGGFISTGTIGSGQGGDLNINATDSVEIVGNPADRDLPDGLFATTGGSGNAGNLTLSTQRLSVRNGGAVSAATAPGSTGRGGNLTITASDSVEVAGITNNGQFPSLLSVRSRGEGQAGNLTVNTPRLTLKNRGAINAESNAADGGNITLNVDRLLLLRQNSSISATAGLAQSAGNGGNITINAPNGFIVAVPRENSDITANAFNGRGGNINITTQGIYGLQYRPRLTPLSDITASSEFGLEGKFQLDLLTNVDPSRGLAELPTNVVNASEQIDRRCTPRGASQRSSFTITGRGGLPPSPNEPLQAESVSTDWVTLDSDAETNTPPMATTPGTSVPKKLVEAQGWMINQQGQVVLTASAPKVTPHREWLPVVECNSSQTQRSSSLTDFKIGMGQYNHLSQAKQ